MWILILTLFGNGTSIHSEAFTSWDTCEKAKIVWLKENKNKSQYHRCMCREMIQLSNKGEIYDYTTIQ